MMLTSKGVGHVVLIDGTGTTKAARAWFSKRGAHFECPVRIVTVSMADAQVLEPVRGLGHAGHAIHCLTSVLHRARRALSRSTIWGVDCKSAKSHCGRGNVVGTSAGGVGRCLNRIQSQNKGRFSLWY